MQISHSKIELYDACGEKYRLQHVERWRTNKTYSALLFGVSLDESLNYILTCVKDKIEFDVEKAKEIFIKKMNEWDRQKSELVYFKYEIGTIYGDEQSGVFAGLCNLGLLMIDTYVSEILPLFQSIDDVQVKHNVKNKDGDNLILIIDFIATLKDGRKVVFDNKTSSDIKKYYGADSVKKSKQLALYSDYYPDYYSGYIALQKKLDKNGKVKWTYVVDKIEESKTSEVFENIEVKTQMIKDGVFEKNKKNCWSFGKKCEYFDVCYKDDFTGLFKK